ncbi:coproporphyrinogen III oxidase [Candidatus Midichloria mitochondrii IricVA]|uniref:Heme chaperone HemW n=2 Tax=Candidatus Midichloria mitochondrii TaxID=234827 RepID=F7XV07_MIDMI|nr:coproporphyrinogen III oxidase [Candidatus Midichloria mitochondrii IricVA]
MVLQCYLQEISLYKDIVSAKKIKSIFFGGGTPSLASPKMFASILEFTNSIGIIDNHTEITIEANPGSSETMKFIEFARAGINRVSIGVQSFDDKALRFLGRKHNASAAKKSIEHADKAFKNYSFDMIYALPWHTEENWAEELNSALEYAKYHISLYQLTIEKGTKFFKDYTLKKFHLPQEELAADLYSITNNILAKNNFKQYEISNYARNPFYCQHNLVYWQYNNYLGIGPGAHGRISINGEKFATVNVHMPEKWIELASKKQFPYQSKELLTADDQTKEKLIMGLRLVDGILFDEFKNDETLQSRINKMTVENLLKIKNGRVSATKRGLLVLNSIINLLF